MKAHANMDSINPSVILLRAGLKGIAVLILGACAATPRPPPAYPWTGFGRLGCYAGPGLDRMFDGDPTPGDSAVVMGPWLVLDSLTEAELRDAGFEGPAEPSYLHPGTLLERVDTIERIAGSWHRLPPDTVVFEEGTVFPPVVWRFRTGADGLRGEGVLVHDIVYQDPDGTQHQPVSRWAVWVRPVPCTDVPVVRNIR